MAATILHLIQWTYDLVIDTKHALFSGTKEITFVATYRGQEIVRAAQVPIRPSFDLAHFLSLLFAEVEAPLTPSVLSYVAREKEVYMPISAVLVCKAPHNIIRVHFVEKQDRLENENSMNSGQGMH